MLPIMMYHGYVQSEKSIHMASRYTPDYCMRTNRRNDVLGKKPVARTSDTP